MASRSSIDSRADSTSGTSLIAVIIVIYAKQRLWPKPYELADALLWIRVIAIVMVNVIDRSSTV